MLCSQTIAKTFSPTGGQLYGNYSCLSLLTRYANLVKVLKINIAYRIFYVGREPVVWWRAEKNLSHWQGHKQRGWILVIFACENGRGQNLGFLGSSEDIIKQSPCPYRDSRTNNLCRYSLEAAVQKCWGWRWGEGCRWEEEAFAHLRAWPKERRITGRALQEQRSWQLPFSPPSA